MFYVPLETSSASGLPSLTLPLSDNNPNTVPVKSKRGRKPGRPPRSSSLSTPVSDGGVVTLEGTTTSPGGSNKRITITIPSIEYPVRWMDGWMDK